MKTGLIAWLAFLISFCSFIAVQAAEVNFPIKPIEVYVGFPPGGGSDLGARVVAEKAKAYLGQEIIVVNKPGGAGITAATLISQAKPDGYLLGAQPDSCYAFLHLFEKLPFDWEDFTYICQYGVLEYGLVVREDSPFRDFKDFIQYARENPEKLTVGTIGINSENTMAAIIAARQEGVKIKMVPFQGAADAIAAVLGGHVMAGDIGVSGWAQHYKAKKIRILAMLGDTRSDAYPEVPCLGEMGYPLSLSSIYLFVGPKNMEKSIRDKLANALVKATESPEWANLTKSLGMWTKRPMLYTDKLKESIAQKRKGFAEQVKELEMGLK